MAQTNAAPNHLRANRTNRIYAWWSHFENAFRVGCHDTAAAQRQNHLLRSHGLNSFSRLNAVTARNKGAVQQTFGLRLIGCDSRRAGLDCVKECIAFRIQ